MELVREIEGIGEEHRKKLKQAYSIGNSEVKELYEDAVVFITGASGFLGKQLVQKLLSSTNVRKIYTLLRPKKGKNIEQRLKIVFDDPVYEFIRKENPDFIEKVTPIEGDVSNLNLGIDDKDWLRLTDEVNIIFHSAATINFEDPMTKATLTNVRGTREILKLAKSCKFLRSIVHVSTAYANATRSKIDGDVKEEFYPSPIPPDTLIKLAETLDQDTLNTMMKSLLSDWPNTYTFTKAVTEDLVRTNARDLPLCIVRPSVVISAIREPSPGWVDIKNAYGPSGLIVGLFLGIVHTILIRQDIHIDYVTVDIVNNASIVAAWDTFQRYDRGDKQTNIYTITSARNPLSFDKFQGSLLKCRPLIPSKALWYGCSYVTSSKIIFQILMFLFLFIPAAVADGTLLLTGEKPRFLKIYRTANSLADVFTYFTNNQWIFHDNNTLDLYNKLSDIDKVIYNFDMANIDIEQMIVMWAYGVIKYIIRDDMDKFDYAIKKQFWLKIAHYVVVPLYLMFIVSIVYFCVSIVCKVSF